MGLINRKRAAAGQQYAIVIGLIGVVALGSITVVGRNVSTLFTGVSNRLGNVSAGSATSPGPAAQTGPLANCKAHRDAGATTNGVYSIDTDGTGPLTPFDVWCDMTNHGGGWTLLESYSFGNNATYSGQPFFHDMPRNASNPANTTDFRLSRTRMQQIDTTAAEWRTTCNFASDPARDFMRGLLNLSDHPGGSETGLDVLDYSGSGSAFTVAAGNIRGYSLSGSVSFWQGDAYAYHLCIDGQYAGVPNSVASEDNFGYYGYTNPAFGCTSSSAATTQWWLR